MSIDEFLGWFFAVFCIIVLGGVLYAFIFGLQVELPAINNGLRYGEGNPHTLNGTPTCEILVGVDNEPQDGGMARCYKISNTIGYNDCCGSMGGGGCVGDNCTFGGGGGSREWNVSVDGEL